MLKLQILFLESNIEVTLYKGLRLNILCTAYHLNMEETYHSNVKTPLIRQQEPMNFDHENGLTIPTQGQNSSSRAPTKNMKPFFIVVVLERFTYYSIVISMFFFFRDDVYQIKDKSTSNTTNVDVTVLCIVGLSWMFCVLGGVLSDAKLGKRGTITLGLFVYAIGIGFLLICAAVLDKGMIGKEHSYGITMVMASFILILFGEGAYKANISAFGAEQLDSKDVDSTRRYFDIYYFCVNIGAMLAVIISAYIQRRLGFFFGYIAPTATIVLAFFIFLFSSHLYTIVPHEQMVGKVFQIFKDARRKRHQNERR